MMGESNQKRSNGTGRDIMISNSRAMGVIVLIALLFVFQVVTFVWHKVQDGPLADGDAAESAGGAPAGGSSAGGTGAVRNVAASGAAVGGRFARGERFRFDPNTISADSLQLLGFSAKQSQSILKYRVKGGKFRYREDFSRLYVVDSAVYAALEGYIALPHRSSGTKGAQNVPGGAVAGTNKGVFVPDGGKNAVLGNTDPSGGSSSADSSGGSSGGTDLQRSGPSNTESSGGIYGKKVERNRYMCNLNTADSAALVQLYGIGGYYARKILRYREVLGGSFVDARQLLEIEGFTQERFARIEKNVFVSEEDVKGFSILNAERKALERHPYIGPYAARGIVTYLKLKGKESFENEMHLLEQLVKEKIIGEGNAQKLREYLLHL
jgi:DNA uptake protein ComE-like DNA-binding protein